jgi:GT2 family glycosyltransferase
MTDISVIIPLGPDETAWKNLLADLDKLPSGTEVLFVVSENSKILHETILLSRKEIRLLSSAPGRGSQMNAGAKAAEGKFLWFLHADSKFGDDTLSALLRAMQNYPDSLLYCDLAFWGDATPFMFLNAWGVYFRSRILDIPFGDQGFCIKKNIFHKLGGFPQDVSYGEDHVFVWKARQHGITVKPICATLYTSARKYKKDGWL